MLQHAATHFNTLQHNTTYRNRLQQTATYRGFSAWVLLSNTAILPFLAHIDTAIHCIALQHTATQRNTPEIQRMMAALKQQQSATPGTL